MNYLYYVNSFLQGKKSYIVTLIGASYVLLDAFGVLDITDAQEKAVFLFLTVAFGVTVRAAIGRS